jgi:hypothetical protein
MASINIVHTKLWDESVPAGSRAKSLGDDDIRDFKLAESERQAIDHKRYTDESGHTDVGTHKKITLTEIQGAKPTKYDNCGYLYLKDVSAVVELFWEDESGNEKQLTTGGALNISATEAVLLTGDQTVAGIKTFSSSPIVPTPTTDYQACTKKYFDDNNFTSADITGIIGAWASRVVNTVYTEGVDGFVIGSISKTDNSNGFVTMQTPNGTVRQKIGGYPNGNYQYSAFMCPVAKAATWKLVSSGTITVDYLFWIPLGS